jgi:chaperonin cofactor prefoldin
MATETSTVSKAKATADKNDDGKLTLTERVEALEAELASMKRAAKRTDTRLTETREVIAPRLQARGLEV